MQFSKCNNGHMLFDPAPCDRPYLSHQGSLQPALRTGNGFAHPSENDPNADRFFRLFQHRCESSNALNIIIYRYTHFEHPWNTRQKSMVTSSLYRKDLLVCPMPWLTNARGIAFRGDFGVSRCSKRVSDIWTQHFNYNSIIFKILISFCH